MKLSQGRNDENLSSGVEKESRGAAAASGAAEKLKASNFPGSLLRIGSWEVRLRYFMSLVYLGNEFFFQ